jgi:outer membrane protein TolC
MMTHHRTQSPLPLRTAGQLVLAVLLCPTVFPAAARPDGAPEPLAAPGHTTPPPTAAPAGTLTLAECLELAFQRQPRLAIQRASLAAAEDGKRALDALCIPTVLDRELPVRRQQAALGVTAAAAALDQAEREGVYAVTRTYFTVLYAREQERVARTVVGRLAAAHDAAQLALKSGARDITTADVNRVSVYLRLARTKQTQAVQGVKRALAALKEAIGLGPDGGVQVPPGRLAAPNQRPNRDEVIAGALARRGELIQASVLAEVTGLEVEAQGTSHRLRMQTFAAGSDIHSRQVPQGFHNGEYRPGAQPPEMPTLLAGSRGERVKHAESLHARAEAGLEETRNLIALEAEDAFLRWEEASREAPDARAAADTGDKLADDLTKQFTSGLKVKVEDVVSAQVLASQARSQYNEFVYHEILALIDLERITAGAFCAGLVGSAAQPQPAPANGNGAK